MNLFLSYSRQNAEEIATLVEDIEALGHDVWYDHEISGGQAWWDQILERIRDCDVFIFALSPHSLESRPCMLESRYAFDLRKRILPILVTEGVITSTLPEALSVIHFIDYSRPNRQSALALSKALINLPPAAPLPESLPEPPLAPIKYLGRLKTQIETDASLSFQEQSALLFELEQHLSEPSERDEVVRLLRLLRRRDDLLAKIGDKIDSLVKSATPAPTPVPDPFAGAFPANNPPQNNVDAAVSPSAQPVVQKVINTPPAKTAYTPQQPVSSAVKPVGFWGVVVPIMVWWLIVVAVISFVLIQSYSSYYRGYFFLQFLAVFGTPGLLVALPAWLYFRGTQIVLPVEQRAQFINNLKSAMPHRFTLISEDTHMLIFKWLSMPPGLKRLNRIYVELDDHSAAITGPARFVNRIQERINR